MTEPKDSAELRTQVNREMLGELEQALSEDGMTLRHWLEQRIWLYLRARAMKRDRRS